MTFPNFHIEMCIKYAQYSHYILLTSQFPEIKVSISETKNLIFDVSKLLGPVSTGLQYFGEVSKNFFTTDRPHPVGIRSTYTHLSGDNFHGRYVSIWLCVRSPKCHHIWQHAHKGFVVLIQPVSISLSMSPRSTLPWSVTQHDVGGTTDEKYPCFYKSLQHYFWLHREAPT